MQKKEKKTYRSLLRCSGVTSYLRVSVFNLKEALVLMIPKKNMRTWPDNIKYMCVPLKEQFT